MPGDVDGQPHWLNNVDKTWKKSSLKWECQSAKAEIRRSLSSINETHRKSDIELL
ncbi:hypothetical protein ACTXT7_003766 [Hymenolepis weldensis]